jgi:hypothetical protein
MTTRGVICSICGARSDDPWNTGLAFTTLEHFSDPARRGLVRTGPDWRITWCARCRPPHIAAGSTP